MSFKKLLSKIERKDCKICVIGGGYVGLPVAVAFGKKNFEVCILDIDKEKVKSINERKSYICDVSSEDIEGAKIRATWDYKIIKDSDVVIICVPTPLGKSKEPDISFIIQAARGIKNNFKPPKLIILESTVYPATTEEVILPFFLKNKLKLKEDFFLAFSPERINPGSKEYKFEDIPKVVSGVTEECADLTQTLYSKVVKKVIRVSSTKTAEMVKLLENTYRIVNIALANEMAILCRKLNLNIWEVIDTAATKPFGFEPFYPGPGLGGHCIPIDPFYLQYKARIEGYEPRFIQLADHIISQMPNYVVNLVYEGLNKFKKSINGSKILVVGLSYKKDVADTRESPAFPIIRMLREKGAHIFTTDPFIKQITVDGLVYESLELTKDLVAEVDCVLILVDHSCYKPEFFTENAKLIVDTRGLTRKIKKENVILI